MQAVYGSNVMTVQHVRKWCREFSGCRVSVTDEQRSGRPSTSADLVPAIEETVCANRRVLLKSRKNSLIFDMAQSVSLFMRFRVQKSVQQVGPSTTDGGPQEKPYGCIPHSFPPL